VAAQPTLHPTALRAGLAAVQAGQSCLTHSGSAITRAAGELHVGRLRIEETMNQTEVEAFVAGMENVQREENFGYVFFFVGDDHRLSFVTIANSDNEWDNVSHLNRQGVFRVNIGISKETFQKLIVKSNDEPMDYSVLNTFLPHPEYAPQNFVCILNPSGDNVETTKKLIAEAHSIAAKRLQRKAKK
jgi:hypothetical protein